MKEPVDLLKSARARPLEFGKVAGLYVATLFIVWQVNFVVFRTMPTLPILVGGAIITLWRPQ